MPFLITNHIAPVGNEQPGQITCGYGHTFVDLLRAMYLVEELSIHQCLQGFFLGLYQLVQEGECHFVVLIHIMLLNIMLI